MTEVKSKKAFEYRNEAQQRMLIGLLKLIVKGVMDLTSDSRRDLYSFQDAIETIRKTIDPDAKGSYLFDEESD